MMGAVWMPESHLRDRETTLPFSDKDVWFFISELSKEGNPGRFLEAWGVCDAHDYDLADMLKEMAVQWLKNESTVSAAAGQHFYKLMRQAALEQWNHENKED